MTSRNHLLSIPLNEYDIPAAQLNIESKARSNLFPWNGQFSPQFVETMLRRYAKPGSAILDPFCGSGTVLAEACRLGMACTGIELNPAAFILARIYTLSRMSVGERCSLTESVEALIQDLMPYGWPLMVALDASSSEDYQARLPSLLARASDAQKVVLEALIILADFFKGVDATKLAKTWQRLRQTIESLPNAASSITLHHGDGRYPDANVVHDMVLTSPPYINVYNYHQQYRASAEALGWNLLHVAKTEIGSNRKNRGNRFLTVTQYCLDLALTLDSIWEATKNDARIIFVMGRESRVRGVPFFNGQIAANLAVDAVGYEIAMRQERVFKNRFGQMIFEDIVHLKKNETKNSTDQILNYARQVASNTLENGLESADDKEVRADLLDAIKRVSEARESPRYHHEQQQAIYKEDEHAISDPSSRETSRHTRKRQTTRERQASR